MLLLQLLACLDFRLFIARRRDLRSLERVQGVGIRKLIGFG